MKCDRCGREGRLEGRIELPDDGHGPPLLYFCGPCWEALKEFLNYHDN